MDPSRSHIPETAVRLATEIGLPPGKVIFDTQFAGWFADFAVGNDVLHTWSDRGEFWASIERSGSSISIPFSPELQRSQDLEAQFRRALLHFKQFISSGLTYG